MNYCVSFEIPVFHAHVALALEMELFETNRHSNFKTLVPNSRGLPRGGKLGTSRAEFIKPLV